MSLVNSQLARISLAAIAAALSLFGQQTFPTPQTAAQALIDACAHNDSAALLQLFGPGGKDVVGSGDPADDKAAREQFAANAHEKLQVDTAHDNPNRATIVIGSKDWPFPIPLLRQNGQWHFDAASGRVEILARRIGRHELTAIDVCRAYVAAQMQFASRLRGGNGMLVYAQHIISTPGKQDGLYYDGQPENLVPKSFAEAAAVLMQGKGKTPVPYHGYFFHILKAQGPAAPDGAMDYVVKGAMIGGFAMVAWPAEYGVSGVKTFIVNHKGVVYEKDLGPQSATLARQMPAFNPDKTWKPISGE